MNTLTNFKGERTPARVLRRRKSSKLRRHENANKEEVREREQWACRFPLCRCFNFNLFLEVSHQEHKGMGGDPTGERSTPEKMLLICNVRHKEGAISIDKGSLRWEALTDAGANGPIAWSIDIGRFSGGMLAAGTWIEIAREASRGVLAPLTENQCAILESLNKQIERTLRGVLDKN